MGTERQEDLTQNSRRAARNDINLHISEAEGASGGAKGRRAAGEGQHELERTATGRCTRKCSRRP